jgi:hypothetical protein
MKDMNYDRLHGEVLEGTHSQFDQSVAPPEYNTRYCFGMMGKFPLQSYEKYKPIRRRNI